MLSKNSDTQKPEAEAGEVRGASAEEMFYLDLLEEAEKQAIPRTNEAINRVIAMATGLAGGSIVFLKDDISTGWSRVLAATFFTAALMVALYGSFPYSSTVGRDPKAIRDEIQRILQWKDRFFYSAYGLILLGLMVAILGSLVKIISQ